MGVEREDQVSRGEVLHAGADGGHAPDAGVAVLDGVAEAAGKGGEVKRQVGRYLAPVDQQLGSLADPRRERGDAHLARAGRR